MKKFLTATTVVAVMAFAGWAVAGWITIPDSSGFGYGKGRNATQGLALVSVVLTGPDLTSDPIGPGETGTILAKWSNPNVEAVSVIQLAHVAGTPIEKVGDASCTAAPSTFTITTQNVPPGTWVATGSGGTVVTSAPISTTAAFPSCLASSEFRMQVVAKAVV
jgi:hypothetical protein